ncbi:imidazolonepropionase [Marinobacterium jannaschii]|uniref:imidazolonepropionase n=1 Tax=Marinobacterium jannaschii TaxID=64970 RepID=UPI0006872EF1|nr:imidazolonepropionase [Marinobacterium jannaschii]
MNDTANTIALNRCDRIWLNARLATFDPDRAEPYGALTGHLIGVKDGLISLIALQDQADLSAFNGEIIDAAGGWITPGLIDCHTHLVFGGNRVNEAEMRLNGASYEEIARQGGGILSTVTATRAASVDELVAMARPRMEALIREGVTTIEIKSGYGLTTESELKMLQAARRLGEIYPVRISTSLLAAHALPPEYKGRADQYIDLVCDEMIPAAAGQNLADAVDAFCETIAFSPEQCARVFAAANQAGLGIKCHAEQLSNLHGAEMAAGFGAWSAEHLEYLDQAGIDAMAKHGTVATLLPGAFYYLRETQRPPVETLRRAGVPIAIASDLNPGSSPIASLQLMLNMACTLFALNPEEALAGVTRHAARALGQSDQLGQLRVGMRADMVLWDIQRPAQLACQFGTNPIRQRIFDGEVTFTNRGGSTDLRR